MNEAYQKEKPSCLKVLAAIGTILGVFLAILTGLSNLLELLMKLPQHVVLQISGLQISIGITIFIALLILVLMGLSFAFGLSYNLFEIHAALTRRKTPFYFRPFEVLSSPFRYLVKEISERSYRVLSEKHPTPLQKRMAAHAQEARLQEQEEKKGG